MWYGFERIDFEFEGKAATVVFPKRKEVGGNWLLKTEYWEAFPDAEIDLLNRGFHLAYIQNISRFATKEDCDRKHRFVQYVSEKFSVRNKCVPVGYSLGGAHAVNFAGFYPDDVCCIYLDAPVLNFCDYPGRMPSEECEGVWKNEFVYAYPGITRAKLLNFSNHPLNKINVLKKHKIPIIMLYGTEDRSVNYSLNGRLLEMEYEDCPTLLKVIPRELQGHHPHGCIYDRAPLIDFILKSVNNDFKDVM